MKPVVGELNQRSPFRVRAFPLLVLGGIVGAAAIIGAGLFIANSTSFISKRFIGPEIPGEVQKSGDEIISALVRYKSEHGQYPSSLEALVPDQLAAIPPCGDRGHEWSYFTPEPDRFELSTRGGVHKYPCLSYDSKRRTWLLDT